MQRDRGFTLIELLIVLAIVSVIAAIAVPGLLRARMTGNETSAIASLRVTSASQIAYSAACGNGGYAASYLILGDPLVALLRGVPDVAVASQGAREDPHERHPPDVRIGNGLERQCRELAVRVRRLADGVRGRWGQRDDRIEQAVDADLARGRGCEHGNQVALADGLRQRRLQRLGRQILAFEVQVDQLVVVLADRLDQ